MNSDFRSWIKLAEALLDVAGSRVYELTTRKQFLGLLKRYNWLRGFVDGVHNDAYAWNADELVHPEVARALFGRGEHGVPVHFEANRISIRPHGLDEDNLKLMYREVINTPLVKALYGGKLPEIWLDDEEEDDRRLDDQGWDDPSQHELDSTSTSHWPEERWTAWRRHWGSY